jgi:hypothetical protein
MFNCTVYLLKLVAGFAPEMLVSRPDLGLETVQDHFLVVLVMVLVSIGPVLVSNTGSKKVLVGLGHCMHGQALKGAFNNHCQSIEGLGSLQNIFATGGHSCWGFHLVKLYYRDVSLETWSWSQDCPRPLFSGLGLDRPSFDLGLGLDRPGLGLGLRCPGLDNISGLHTRTETSSRRPDNE